MAAYYNGTYDYGNLIIVASLIQGFREKEKKEKHMMICILNCRNDKFIGERIFFWLKMEEISYVRPYVA